MKAIALDAIPSAEQLAPDSVAAIVSSDTERRFRLFVETYQELVVNTCYHFLRDADEAHDVAQEVFVAAHLHQSRITEHSSWRAWLYRTASHRSLNALRARKRRRWLRPFESLRDEGIDPATVAVSKNKQPDREIETAELRRALELATEKLPGRQRMAFVLHRYEGLSNSEIAVIMLLRVNAVDQLLHRARTFMRKQLFREYQEFIEP
jgi:RNA polymerase sigma factor (sigma-70 family)